MLAISIIEEETYRFIRPLWEACFLLDTSRNSFPVPCGPTLSLHPRSILRDERNKEDKKESVRTTLWDKSTKNHWRERALWVEALTFSVISCLIITMASVVPITVITNGRDFTFSGSVIPGATNMNFEKNQPEIKVPRDNRNKAPFRFFFSSPIGEREEIFGFERKQNTTTRSLYTAVSKVATILRDSPRAFSRLAPVASSIRSLE